MDDLAEFLLARIAEDEAAAKSTPFAPTWWPNVRLSYTGIWAADSPEGMGRSVGHATTPENAEHILRWDPARILAECDAKRRIVEVWDEAPWALRFLALPYADHPDYDEEWKP